MHRLVRAGAVLLGKLATYEFALVGPTFDEPSHRPSIRGTRSTSPAGRRPARPPRWRPEWCAARSERTRAGRSASPACYCGVVGLKPTFGRVSRHGVFPVSPSLDHVGPISATVAEAAITLDAIAGYDDARPVSVAADGVACRESCWAGQRHRGPPRRLCPRLVRADSSADARGVLSAMDDAVSATQPARRAHRRGPAARRTP